jgi:hypothetical protein
MRELLFLLKLINNFKKFNKILDFFEVIYYNFYRIFIIIFKILKGEIKCQNQPAGYNF